MGFDTYDCGACGLRQCSNALCVSHVLTTDCCGKDCCGVCTYMIPIDEAMKRCAVRRRPYMDVVLVCFNCLNNTASFNHSKCVAPNTA